MIELFKIIKGIYDSTCVSHVDFVELSKDLIRTRGNNFKLIQHHCHYQGRIIHCAGYTVGGPPACRAPRSAAKFLTRWFDV